MESNLKKDNIQINKFKQIINKNQKKQQIKYNKKFRLQHSKLLNYL